MSDLCVRDVMTPSVVVVTADCRYQNIVDVITDFGVSGMPVVDDDNRVVGVVSEADLLPKVRRTDGDTDVFAGTRSRRHRLRLSRRKAAGRTARDLMTSPPVTVPGSAGIAQAARLMEQHRVRRLPVLDDATGRLIGIVTRRDLLRRCLRSDEAIERDVIDDVLVHTRWLDPISVDATVSDGVVTLRGTAQLHSTAQLVTRLVGALDGVTGVVNEITWQTDDDGTDRREIFDAELR